MDAMDITRVMDALDTRAWVVLAAEVFGLLTDPAMPLVLVPVTASIIVAVDMSVLVVATVRRCEFCLHAIRKPAAKSRSKTPNPRSKTPNH